MKKIVINNIDFNIEMMNESDGKLMYYTEIDSLDKLNFRLNEVPENIKIAFTLSRNNELKCNLNSSFLLNSFEVYTFENSSKVVVNLFNQPEEWNSKWDIKNYTVKMWSNFEECSKLKIEERDIGEYGGITYLQADIVGEMTLIDTVTSLIQEIDDVLRITELELGGIKWKEEYLKNEKIFSVELVYPLLRVLGFSTVVYNHGVKEYGKDFICSEIDRFGFKKYIGIQVKAGNLRGNVNSDIDEILGQLENNFSMPFYELGVKSPKYISSFIILTSGVFTDNAKDKIAAKIPLKLIGSVFFIDKPKIMDLIEEVRNKI